LCEDEGGERAGEGAGYKAEEADRPYGSKLAGLGEEKRREDADVQPIQIMR
jgi:hypothetical protein